MLKRINTYNALHRNEIRIYKSLTSWNIFLVSCLSFLSFKFFEEESIISVITITLTIVDQGLEQCQMVQIFQVLQSKMLKSLRYGIVKYWDWDLCFQVKLSIKKSYVQKFRMLKKINILPFIGMGYECTLLLQIGISSSTSISCFFRSNALRKKSQL